MEPMWKSKTYVVMLNHSQLGVHFRADRLVAVIENRAMMKCMKDWQLLNNHFALILLVVFYGIF